MKFYSIKQKKAIEVAASKVEVRKTKNDRFQAVAEHNGETLYKFVSAADAKKLSR